MAKVTNLKMGIQAGTTRTVYMTWSFASKYEKNVDHYSVNMYYYTGQGIKFDGGSSDVKTKSVTYNAPENATTVYMSVKPVSKKYKSKKKEVSYWTGERVGKSYYLSKAPPEQLSAPNVEIDDRTLTATVETYDSNADKVEFYIARDNSKYASATVDVVKNQAQYVKTIGINGTYRVKARAVNVTGSSKVYGEWSQYSGGAETRPNIPTYVALCVQTDTSIRVSWEMPTLDNVDSFEIQCVSERDIYFNSPGQIKSTTIDEPVLWAIVSDLEPGKQWFFRVRSKNSQGESPWSTIKSIKLGTKPDAPTTWSLTNTAMVGDPITLYWVHNSEDNSIQQKAEIYVKVNDLEKTITIDTPSMDKDDVDKIYSKVVDTTSYELLEGATFKWKVRTKGIVAEWGPWSELRTIKVYMPPSVDISLSNSGEITEDNILTALPLKVDIQAWPETQKLTSLLIEVTAEDTYEAEDELGRPVIISAGTSMYRNIYNSSLNPRTVTLSANHLKLENGQLYKVKVTTAMNSGLTATTEEIFEVSWSDEIYDPDASVIIDDEALSAYIKPYCTDDDDYYIADTKLSVYRREFDGTFTEIETKIPNTGKATVTDPHPALDYARYRIVATNTLTGQVAYSDIPGIPVDEPSIVIQWDENWTQYDYEEDDIEDELAIPPWNGSMVKIPYNVDVSERHSNDQTLVRYVGRQQPVSYYGTHRGNSATWSCVIPKEDKETLYSLRRLAEWMGDAYVREPSGTGYWAQINVSMDVKHKDTTIPVTFEINRVEGDK